MKYYLLTIPDNCKLECTYFHPEDKDNNPAHLISITERQYKYIIKQLTR